MPNNTLPREVATESTGYGAEQDRHEVPDGSYIENKALRTAQRLASSTTKQAQFVSRDLSSEPPKLERSDADTSNNSGGQSGDNPMQVSDPTSTRRPIETAIWDWDTPLESVGDASSYYYEPQGELMQEHSERPNRSEFSIPHPVSNVNWPFASETNDGFAVPRRVGSLVPSIAAGVKRKSVSDRDFAAGQSNQKRASRTMSESGEEGQSPMEGRQQMQSGRPPNGTRRRSQSGTDAGESRRQPSISESDTLRPPGPIGGNTKRSVAESPGQPTLPPRKVFPIQVGEKLFRLSGASICSDGPSYFTQYFEEQLRQNDGTDNVRTLYIDRDPTTFEDIVLHLQGYHLEPHDGPHFVKLFADAQFFSLPRLTAQLFSSTIYIRIGEEEFQISRDLFSAPGDSPNYFSLGFSIFFSTPSDVFPGLSQRALLRPPSILAPSIPNRSSKIFADILHILKGYPVEIRSEEHRAALLRDARYFHLKGLEQRLIPHQISYNLARKKSEIVIRIEDIRQSGISFVADHATPSVKEAASTPNSPASSTAEAASNTASAGWVYYQRPYVDSEAHSLVVEISGDESTFLSVAPGNGSQPTARAGRATFHRQTLSRITSLFSVIANKMNLPINQPLGLMMEQRGAGVASLPVSPGNTGLSEEKVKVRIGSDADVIVDGRKWNIGGGSAADAEDEADEGGGGSMEVDNPPSFAAMAMRKSRLASEDEGEEWIVKKAQYRIRVQPVGGAAIRRPRGPMEVILGAIKIEAYSSERGRNRTRGFLS